MLQTRSLTRRFGDRTVVDGLDLTVQPGRLTGFVGSNGAGKTTTMRMLLGVLAPSEGDVLWDGQPVTTEQRRRFGYMPEERGLFPRQPILEQLVFLARLHGATTPDATARSSELLEMLGLGERKNDLLDELSLGNQQRVQVAAALVHHPEALVLDEPFSGLDPVAVDQMTDLLHREAADLPVLFSSHQLDLVERLCDDIIILAGGRVVAHGSVDDLRAEGVERYRVRLDGEDAGWIRSLGGITVTDVDGETALVDLDGTSGPDLLAAVAAKSRVAEFARVQQPLSELYREVATA